MRLGRPPVYLAWESDDLSASPYLRELGCTETDGAERS